MSSARRIVCTDEKRRGSGGRVQEGRMKMVGEFLVRFFAGFGAGRLDLGIASPCTVWEFF